MPTRYSAQVKFMFALVFLLSFALFLATPVLAQMTNVGRISGTVTDASQGVIVGATITVTNEATGLSRTVTTNDQGFYVVTNLPVGSYSIAAAHQGFGKEEKAGHRLYADGRLSVDFILEPGKVTATVEVTATGESVNTTSGEVSRVIDQQQVQDLALNGRNYIQLVSLIPGVVLVDEDQMAVTTSLSAGNQSINGMRTNQNLLTVDGGFDLDSGSNGSQINNVGVDFIQEVGIKTSNFSAEYGRNSGGAIDVVTRRGGNRFHGALFEFLRNDKLDAGNFFSPKGPDGQKQKQKLRFNDFGWDLGGPIIKNKLFFFVGEEWKRIRQNAAPARRTLPTTAELSGDFSGSGGALFLPGTNSPIPGRNLNNVPGGITPDGRAIAALFAAMQKQAASFTEVPRANNAIFQVSEPFNWREDIIRVDYTINAKQNIYLRYLHDSYSVTLPFGFSCSANLPTCPQNRLRPGTSYQLSHTWLATPKLVNETILSAAWNGQRILPTGDSWQRSVYGFVFPQYFSALGGGGRFRDSIPDIRFSGTCGTLPGRTTQRGCPANVGGQSHSLLSPTTDITASETVTWSRAAHTAKFGFVVIRNRKDQNARSPYAGLISFNSSGTVGTNESTGNALADALLGNFRGYEEAFDDPTGQFRFTQYHSFVMDTWKLARNFSLELGLRFEHHVPSYTTANNIANFDTSLYDPTQAVTVLPDGSIDPTEGGNRFNGMIRAGSGVPEDQLKRVPNGHSPEVLAIPAGAPRGLYPSRNAFAPRVGFALAPFGNGKTSIRGGFGVFYDTPEGNMDFDELDNPPFSTRVNFLNVNISNPSGGTPPGQSAISISAVNPDLKLPYTMSYSLNVQRELPRGVFLELSYVGNQVRHLIRKPDINQPVLQVLIDNPRVPSKNVLRPYKGYAAINMFRSDANSNYNSLQAYVSKRKGDLKLTGSYTYSKALTDAGPGSIRDSGSNDNIQEVFLRHLDYGPAAFDRTHVFVVTYSYTLPFFRHSSAFLRGALGGWELSGITRAQSGKPFTVTANPRNSFLGRRRADYVSGQSIKLSHPSPERWFNTDAFAPAPDTRLGSTGSGTVRGPGLYTWDLSLRKMFNLPYEGWTLRFQADMFNVFNRANFRFDSTTALVVSNTNITDGNYGRVTSAGPPRNIQFGLKFTF